MKINELKEIYNLTLKQISEKTGISYSRVCKLNRQEIKYSMKDIEAIRDYIENMGNNVIYIDFKPRENTREPFKWEQRREIDLNEYKDYKKEQQRIKKSKNKKNPLRQLKVQH